MSKTELINKLLRSKKSCIIQFTKKDNAKRVISGKTITLDSFGYLLVKEDLSNNFKKIDTRTLCSAVVDGETLEVC